MIVLVFFFWCVYYIGFSLLDIHMPNLHWLYYFQFDFTFIRFVFLLYFILIITNLNEQPNRPFVRSANNICDSIFFCFHFHILFIDL